MSKIVGCMISACENSQTKKDTLISAGILPLMLRTLSYELDDPEIVFSCASMDTPELLEEIRNIGTLRLFEEKQLTFSNERILFMKAFCSFFGSPDAASLDRFDSHIDPDEDPFSWMSSLALGSSLDTIHKSSQPMTPRARTQNSLFTFSSSRTVTPSSTFSTTKSSTSTGSPTITINGTSGNGRRKHAFFRLKRLAFRGLNARTTVQEAVRNT
jgi:hypothetical protein